MVNKTTKPLAHAPIFNELAWLVACIFISLGVVWLLPTKPLRILASGWLILETLFWAYQRTRVFHTANNAPLPKYDHIAVEDLTRRFLQLGRDRIFSLQDFTRAWFFGAPLGCICRGNIQQLVSYGFYTQQPDALDSEQRMQVDTFIDQVQLVFDYQFPPGHNHHLHFLAHLWQPLRVWHKPLALYTLIEAISLLASRIYTSHGFQKHRHGGFDVFVQHERGAGTPIVLLHGVGFGLLPYLPLVQAIRKACPTSPLVVVEAHHVSQRVCPDGARSVDDVAHCVLEVLQCRLGASQACMVGHSYGSFVVARLLHMQPSVVHSCVLVDPVSMMICYPQLLSAFVYADMTPRHLTSLRGLFSALRLLVSRDVIIAESFCRKFCWRALMLWAEDLPERSVVAIGGADDLVPGRMIRASMEACGKGKQVLWFAESVHGDIVLSGKRQAVVEAVQQFCSDGFQHASMAG